MGRVIANIAGIAKIVKLKSNPQHGDAEKSEAKIYDESQTVDQVAAVPHEHGSYKPEIGKAVCQRQAISVHGLFRH